MLNVLWDVFLQPQIDMVRDSIHEQVDIIKDRVNLRLDDFFDDTGLRRDYKFTQVNIRNISTPGFEFLSLGDMTIEYIAIARGRPFRQTS